MQLCKGSYQLFIGFIEHGLIQQECQKGHPIRNDRYEICVMFNIICY